MGVRWSDISCVVGLLGEFFFGPLRRPSTRLSSDTRIFGGDEGRQYLIHTFGTVTGLSRRFLEEEVGMSGTKSGSRRDGPDPVASLWGGGPGTCTTKETDFVTEGFSVSRTKEWSGGSTEPRF